MTADAGLPTGTPTTSADDSVTTTLAHLSQFGPLGDFSLRPQGQVQCFSCQHVFSAVVFSTKNSTRLEGESDPDDMMIILVGKCPNCYAEGALSLKYGPNASDHEMQALLATS